MLSLRIIVAAAVGGSLITVALSLPLFLFLPAHYTDSWNMPAPPVPEVAGYVAGLLLTTGAGYAAARWTWASSRAECLETGVCAGFIAALPPFCLLAAATAGMVGCGSIYLHGARFAGNEQQAAQLVCDATVRITWLTYLTFCFMVIAGAVLGGLGGWLHHRLGAAPWGTQPPVIAAEPLEAAIGMLIIAALSLVVGLGVGVPRAHMVEVYMAQYALELSWPPQGIVGWPIVMNLIILSSATWICGRCWAWRAGGADPEIRREVRSGKMLLWSLPLITLGPGILFYASFLYRDPAFLCGAAVWAATSILALRQIARAQAAPANIPAQVPPQTHRLLVNASLLAVVIPPFVMLAGAANAFTYHLGIEPFVPVLFGKAAPTDSVPTPGEKIPQIYAIHLVYTTYKVVAWTALATLHGCVVLWLRRPASGAVRKHEDATATPRSH